MRRIRALASLIALSIWRGRGLWSGLILGIVAGGSARFFATASLGQNQRVLIDLLLAITTIGSLFIAWLNAHTLSVAEQDRGTGLLLASKPLTPWEYALGRWLGLLLGSGLIYFFSSIVALMIASWQYPLPIAELFLSWLMSGGELFVLTALANLLSSWTMASLASLLTLALWLVGHSVNLLTTSVAWLQYLLPNLDRFNLHETYVQALRLPVSYYLTTWLYALAWSVALTALAALATKQRRW